MTDKIYQNTKLGESLLNTLQGLCDGGQLDAAQARQIAADFDEVMAMELRAPENYGSKKAKLTGTIARFNFSNVPPRPRDGRWMGQGGPTWFFWVENAKIETGADKQAIALEGVTKLTIRHVWTDDNYTKSKKKQQKEREAETKRAKNADRRAVLATQKKAAKDEREKRLGNGAVARAGKRRRAASEATSKASPAGGKKGGFWAARKRGTAGVTSGTAAPKFPKSGFPRTGQPAGADSDSDSEEEDGGNVEQNDSADDLGEDVDDLLENFDADEDDDETSRRKRREVGDRIPSVASRIASRRRRSRRDEEEAEESKNCRDEEVSEAESDDLQADSATLETGGHNSKKRSAATEMDPGSSKTDSDSADESEDAEMDDDLAELAELTGYLEDFQKKTAAEPPPLPRSERSDDANPATASGNATAAAAAAAAPVRSLKSKARRSDEGANGEGSKMRQVKSVISSANAGILGNGKGKGKQISCSMVDDAGKDDGVGGYDDDDDDDDDDEDDDDDRCRDRGSVASIAQADAGFSGRVSAAAVDYDIGPEGNERNGSNDSRNASSKVQGDSPIEEKERSIRERRGHSSRGQPEKLTAEQRNGSTERIAAMDDDSQLLEYWTNKKNEDSDADGKVTSNNVGIGGDQSETSEAGENNNGEEARGGGWGKRGTQAASMMSSLTPLHGNSIIPELDEGDALMPTLLEGRKTASPPRGEAEHGRDEDCIANEQTMTDSSGEDELESVLGKGEVKGLPRGESAKDDEDEAGDSGGSSGKGDGRRGTSGGCLSWRGGGISLENLELTSSDDDSDGNDDSDEEGVNGKIAKSCGVSSKTGEAKLSLQRNKSRGTSSDSDSEADGEPKENKSGVQKLQNERLQEQDVQFESDLEEGLEEMVKGLENEEGDAAGAEKAVKNDDESGEEAGSGTSSDDEDGSDNDDSNEETIRDFQNMLNGL